MIHQLITNTRQGDITFHADGRIDITAHVAGTLHLQRGDVLNIATTDDTPAEHYLYVARRAGDTLGRHAGACKPAKGNGHYFRLHSKRLACHILETCQKQQRVTLCVGCPTHIDNLGTALPLITAPFQQTIFIDPQP